MHILALELGGIHKLDMLTSKGEGVSLKCQRYYISLCSKLVNEGEEVNNPQNSVNVICEWPFIGIPFKEEDLCKNSERDLIISFSFSTEK